MRVLFIYTNINGFHTNTYSFGLASIISVAKINGHEPKVIIVHEKNEYSSVFELIKDFGPTVIGFSAVSSQFNFIREMANEIKARYPGIIIACGGIHPTIDPHCLLECKSLDVIFVGEAERSFVEFLDKIERNENYKDVDNLGYEKDGKLVVNKLKPLIVDLDSLPYPDKDIYPYNETLKAVGYAPFLFSKGCPYLCSYCSNHAIAKTYNIPRNTPRYRSAESSISEIEDTVRKHQINKIVILDDMFGFDPAWRQEFCEKYKKRIKIKFQCSLRPTIVDEKIIVLLKEAGCYRVSMSIESGNEHVRSVIMNRQMSNGQIISAFAIAMKHGLETNALNIIGLPGETEEMIRETIALNKRIRPTSSGVNIFYPYKGTQLGDRCFKDGLVDETLYYSFSDERRRTVLKYPEDYRKKLAYYNKNWDSLIYPLNIRFKKRVINMVRKSFLIGPFRFLKKMALLGRSYGRNKIKTEGGRK